MGDYPQKNRPAWRARLGSGRRKGEKIKPPVPRNVGFASGPRCKAIARGSGKPCRNRAMIGSPCCHKHGGHVHAYRAEVARLGKDKVISLRTGVAAPRKILAKRGCEERTPPGLPYLASPIDRGYAIEAYENRDLDRQSWVETTKKHSK